jgi:hypothetical protein
MGSPQRTYLPLFLVGLIRNHIFDFKDVGSSLLGLWMMVIVKPLHHLAYENLLAETLQQKGLAYVQDAIVPVGVEPEYAYNKDYFEFTLAYMRTTLRGADSMNGKQLREEYGKCLGAVMQRMKDDLRAIRSDAASHGRYMWFVRQIIGLIKSHGVGICVVDGFFTQASTDYSPPMEDPQLHTAGIIAYGIRLGEGESTAAPQLFHYLYNNFKIALANDKLNEESKIIENAMGSTHVLSFMLSRVLPAIIWATYKANETWPLLDVYVGALQRLLTRSALSKELEANKLEDVAALFKCIVAWFRSLHASGQRTPSIQQLQIITRLTELVVIIQPSLMSWFFSDPSTYTAELRVVIPMLGQYSEAASQYLDGILGADSQGATSGQSFVGGLFGSLPEVDGQRGWVFNSGRELDPQVDNYANVIVADANKNWIVTDTSISLNTPGRPLTSTPGASLTQGITGVRFERMDFLNLVLQLRYKLCLWRLGRKSNYSRTRQNLFSLKTDDFVF